MISRLSRALATLLLAALVATGSPASAQTIPGITAPAAAPAAEAAPEAAAPPLGGREAAAALIRVLEDETARTRLLEDLRRLSTEPAAAAPAANGAEADKPAPAAAAAPAADAGQTPLDLTDDTLARELGEYTQSLAREISEFVVKIWRGLSNLLRLFNGSMEIDWSRVLAEIVPLLGVMLVAFTTLFTLRWIARWPLNRLADLAADRPQPVRRVVFLAFATALDLVIVGFAWLAAGAYLVANSAGTPIDLIESLFLNAFALIEVCKAVIRAVFQPRRPALRVFPISDPTARYWNWRLARLVGFLGYGVMLVVPIVNSTIAFAVGIGVRLAIVLIALVTMIALVLKNRVKVRDGLIDAAMTIRGGALSASLAVAARAWHLFVIAYLTVAFAIWVSRPFDAVSYMATATIQTLVIFILGGGLMSLMSRAITGGIRLPADVKRALPLLENRLNLLIPSFLGVLRILMFIVVLAAVFQAWQLIDVAAWMDSEGGRALVGRIVTALVIVLIAMVIWIAATSWIEYRLNPASGRVSTARARTLFSLFRNAFTILLVVITAMLALSELGVDIAPLIAGAGVLGLAVGFGSQKLVQDIITGAFIQFENAMNEGDVVTVANISGVVERLTIRSVGLRDVNGVYHVVPFSSVDSVSNAMRGFAFHVADVSVAYKENIQEVKRLMGVAFERLMATPSGAHVLEPLEMNGVQQMTENAVVIRGRIKTVPGQQWGVGRAYTEIIKEVLDENGIEIPFPQQTVWFGHPKGDDGADIRVAGTAALGGSTAEPRRGRRRRTPLETVDVPDSPRRREDEDDGPDDDDSR